MNKLSFCLAFLLTSMAASADHIIPPEDHHPNAESMIVDGLVYRPLAIAGTVIGTGVYIVTLPFSLLGGNEEQARERLVVDPAEAAFRRCLGCVPDLHDHHYRRRR